MYDYMHNSCQQWRHTMHDSRRKRNDLSEAVHIHLHCLHWNPWITKDHAKIPFWTNASPVNSVFFVVQYCHFISCCFCYVRYGSAPSTKVTRWFECTLCSRFETLFYCDALWDFDQLHHGISESQMHNHKQKICWENHHEIKDALRAGRSMFHVLEMEHLVPWQKIVSHIHSCMHFIGE